MIQVIYLDQILTN